MQQMLRNSTDDQNVAFYASLAQLNCFIHGRVGDQRDMTALSNSFAIGTSPYP